MIQFTPAMIWQKVRQRSHQFIAGFMVVCLVSLLTTCHQPLAQFSSHTRTQLIDSTRSDPETFNVALRQTSADIFSLLYEGLVKINGFTGKLNQIWQKVGKF